MTTSRSYAYLGLAIVVSLVVWFLENPTAPKKGDRVQKAFFENLDTSTVAAIQIEHLLNGVKLKKENGEWFVANLKTKMREDLEKSEPKESKQEMEYKWYKADSAKISMCLDILIDLDKVSLGGANPAKHGFFEVNPVGMHIQLFDSTGKRAADFYVGKAGPAFMDGFVRNEGENEVYLTNRFLRPYFSATMEGWVPAKNDKKAAP